MLPLLLCSALAPKDPFVAKLPDGTQIRLVRLSDDAEHRAWYPDGIPAAPLKKEPIRDPSRVKPHVGDLAIDLELITGQHAPAQTAGAKWLWTPDVKEFEPETAEQYEVLTTAVSTDSTTWHAEKLIKAPTAGGTFDLTVEVADDDWKTVETAHLQRGQVVEKSTFLKSVTNPLKVGKLEVFPFEIPKPWRQYDTRFFAYDHQGNRVMDTQLVKIDRRPPMASFAGNVDDIDHVELQVRPYKKVHFSSVHSAPVPR